ncbi:MAG TPA: NEW3 domain-containing protein [Trebonia sp.]|nr:NEW3 domain-containing protein [Trebonia sp.]
MPVGAAAALVFAAGVLAGPAIYRSASAASAAPQVPVTAATGKTGGPVLPSWAIGPFARYSDPGSRPYQGNPIMMPSGSGWESNYVFNPGVIYRNDKFDMLYRGQESGGESQIGLATSTDGHHFTQYSGNPVITGDGATGSEAGAEDPRLYELDGVYYTFFTAFSNSSGYNDNIAEAYSTDLIHWTQLGVVEPQDQDAAVVTNPDDQPVKINGRYVMYYGRSSHVSGVAYSTDMRTWTDSTPVNLNLPASYAPDEMCVAVTDYQTVKGAPPNQDILMFVAGNLMSQGRWYYALSEEEFSRSDLTSAADQLTIPIMQPTTPYETIGQTHPTIFMNSILFHNGQWWLYYGAGDNVIALATSPLRSQASAAQYGDFTSTSFEDGQRMPDWASVADSDPGGGGISNVTSPGAMVMYQEKAHSGDGSLSYSGTATGAAQDYAYMKVFDLSSEPVTVTPQDTLSYWIYPEDEAATCESLDLVFSDGTALRDLDATDERGRPLTPSGQCGTLAIDQWNLVTADIGSVAAGQQVSRIDIGFDDPGASGGFQGYIDDVSLQQQSGRLSVPSSAVPGSMVTATATFTNTTGHTLTGLEPSLLVPAGWPAARLTSSVPRAVAPGQQATLTWNVTVPASASSGVAELTADLRYDQPGPAGSFTASGTFSVPYASLAAAFNNVGVVDDSSMGAANLGGGTGAYSAQALAADGVTPGGQVTSQGLAYTWPTAVAGTDDNVECDGQTVAVSGTGSTLGVLGSAYYGPLDGQIVLHYTDGSSQTTTLGLSDWTLNASASAPSYGDVIVATMPYRDLNGGTENPTTSYLFSEQIPLAAAKTLTSVTLPGLPGKGAEDVFALTVGTPAS